LEILKPKKSSVGDWANKYQGEIKQGIERAIYRYKATKILTIVTIDE
jgi:hypothetical protein